VNDMGNNQDSFLRSDDLDYVPNRITINQAQEVTISKWNESGYEQRSEPTVSAFGVSPRTNRFEVNRKLHRRVIAGA
jgi:hypothetical protein